MYKDHFLTVKRFSNSPGDLSFLGFHGCRGSSCGVAEFEIDVRIHIPLEPQFPYIGHGTGQDKKLTCETSPGNSMHRPEQGNLCRSAWKRERVHNVRVQKLINIDPLQSWQVSDQRLEPRKVLGRGARLRRQNGSSSWLWRMEGRCWVECFAEDRYVILPALLVKHDQQARCPIRLSHGLCIVRGGDEIQRLHCFRKHGERRARVQDKENADGLKRHIGDLVPGVTVQNHTPCTAKSFP